VIKDGASLGAGTISLNFAPDFVWLKARSEQYWHGVHDVIRGATKTIYTNRSDADATGELTHIGTNGDGSSGFTVTTTGVARFNELTSGGAGEPYVGWCLKAGGAASTTSPAGSLASTSSVASHGGFSIVSYTGTGSATTVGHGLSRKPSMIIIKQLTDSGNRGKREKQVNQ
jgi:hypothetical protein